MDPFDKEYLERREKQIHELVMLRYMTGACAVTGVMMTLIAVALLDAGYGIGAGILLAVGLLFDVGALFMVASYFAENAADQAIQAERHELMALYGKPKRGENGAVRLSDDGELVMDEEDEPIRHRAGQSR